MHSCNHPRENCVQRVERLADKFHQLSGSLKQNSAQPLDLTVTFSKPCGLTAPTPRENQISATKGGDVVDCQTPTCGAESNQEENDTLWGALVCSRGVTGKAEPTTSDRLVIADDDMYDLFVHFNELVKEEAQAIVEVSAADYELPLRTVITAPQHDGARGHTINEWYEEDENHNSMASLAETVVTSNTSLSAEVYHDSVVSFAETVIISNQS